MSLIHYLTVLNNNLDKSINNFKRIVSHSECESESEIIKLAHDTNQKLYTYLDEINKLHKRLKKKIEGNTFLLPLDVDVSKLDFSSVFKPYNYVEPKDQSVTQPKSLTKKLSQIEDINIYPNSVDIPIIDNIKNIPPMFHWYEGDAVYKKGIYVCICKGFYVKVSMPSVVPTSDTGFKLNSIQCKYETKENCAEKKKKISEVFNTEIRECTFVHKKEKFIKVGSHYRCNVESFGNADTLERDLDLVKNSDIKHLLMYSLSDDLLTLIWYQNKFKNGNLFLSNLDMFC